MAKKTVRDLPADLTGKKVLVRFDLNVGIDEATGEIRNDRRIRASLPTLKFLLDRGAAVIAMSHLGRPKPGAAAEKNKPFQMDHVAARLGELIGQNVLKANDVSGPDAKAKAASLTSKQVLLLENVRFDAREQPVKEATDEQKAAHDAKMAEFAAEIAAMGDIYVNDAFGTLHNKDVSVLALPKAMKGKPRAIGLLVEKELKIIDDLLSNPPRPMLAIMGGAKVTDKIKFMEVLLNKVDSLLIGGKMTYIFLKAKGVDVGGCKVDPADVAEATKLLPLVGTKITLPVDYVVANNSDLKDYKAVEGAIAPDFSGVDIGPKTIAAYSELIRKAKTVIWNGPVGWFEQEAFSTGTRSIAAALKECPGTTVVGGGETAEAVEEFGLADAMTHVSTGGGAFLKYVEERKFKTLDQIDDA